MRPNVNYSYRETRVPAGGALTLQAGLVYEPLPPPRDEVYLVVIVTFRDGTSVRAETRLVTGG